MNDAIDRSLPGGTEQDNTILLESKSSRIPSTGMRVALAGFGLLLAGHAACFGLFSGGKPSIPFSQAFVGIICILAAGWRRAFTLTSAGLLRSTSRWGARKSDLLPWNAIRHVSLVSRKNGIVALFEREEITGIKVLFDPEQEQALRAILERHLPKGTEIQTL